jgi:hypothetical protein
MMASNDDNKRKYDKEELAVATKRQRLGNDNGDDSSFGESSKETTEMEMEPKEVSSE